MRKITLLSMLVVAVLLSTSCEKKSVPSLSTDEATDITYSTATVGGNVKSDGNETITARGIVWSENQNPTLSDNSTVHEINYTGAFSNTLTDLSPATTYYARAYATNSEGTGYGNQISFTTDELTNFIQFKGDSYDLEHGYLEYYGQINYSPASYNFDVILLSSGFDYDYVTDVLSGVGHIVYFEMFSSSANDLMPGTYTFDINETYAPNTFDYGFFISNLNVVTETAELEIEILGGEVEISKMGSIYTINIDCTDMQGNPISGYFSGELQYSDWSTDWSIDGLKSAKKDGNKGFRFYNR